ncbi:sigma-70 family RNA polymerase sigma factor [Ideonella azotifigens]|uniref:Sigma-70 family RNA polymerase sigma factor n=2 Tax=Ideonella azotifigens TaxID=513160 RepID=A0ABP3VL44_9BURK|nr:sigma-70 family RNA polymerase sigma factor [Ideonella azotifigens]MCD2343699.1 sigma-70 family RNA polymerase sigma factor [Ideonella azotifigens]
MQSLLPPHPLACDPALRRRLTSLARLWLGNHADAEDVVQDAYLRSPVLPQGAQAQQAWLLTVVRNLCTDLQRHHGMVRRKHAEAGPALAVAESAEAEALLADEVRAALRHVAQHLAPEDAAAVLLHEVFDFEHAEIARLAGRAEAASRQRLHRALRKLRAAAPAHPRDDADSPLFALCWHALQQHSPAALIALLRPPTLSCTAAGAAPQAGGGSGIQPTVLQLHGRLMLAVRLGGAAGGPLLCLLPLGPLQDLHNEPHASA